MLAIAALAVLLPSCKKEADSGVEGCGVEEKTYRFFPASHLELHRYGPDSIIISPEIIKGSGNKLVFQYLRTVDKSACNCADCGEGDWVLFEVDDSLVSFEYEEADLGKLNMVGGGFSGFAGRFIMYEVEQGAVQGLRISDKDWDIKLDIVLAGGRPIEVKHRFQLQ